MAADRPGRNGSAPEGPPLFSHCSSVEAGGRRGKVANLRPFPPGVSGNPGGRRKGTSLTRRLNAILDRTEFDGEPLPAGRCVADLVAEAIVREAIAGRFPFAKGICDRLEGKVADRLAGPVGGRLLDRPDLSRLSEDELDLLGRIAEKIDGSDSPDDPPTTRGEVR
jgi:hypothetical protein